MCLPLSYIFTRPVIMIQNSIARAARKDRLLFGASRKVDKKCPCQYDDIVETETAILTGEVCL